MDEDLKQELDWMIANLNTVVKNQAEIYEELKKIEDEIRQEPKA
jgi:hypothetical protein